MKGASFKRAAQQTGVHTLRDLGQTSRRNQIAAFVAECRTTLLC